MTSRYLVARPLTRARLKAFVALDNLTQQMPLIEIVQGANPHARVWVAYDYERERGTYTAIFPNGRVSTITVYPGNRIEEKLNRPADRVEYVKRHKSVSKRTRRNAGKKKHRSNAGVSA